MKYLLMLIILLTLNVAQAEVYKYINKQGKTSYSDLPVENSELIKLPPVMTYQAPVLPKHPAVNDATSVLERGHYESIFVKHPSAEGTVRSNQGIVTVSYELSPSIQEGHAVELYIDGVKRQGLTVQGLNRGQHTLYIQVVNKQGNIMISSPDVIFYLQHQSRLLNKVRI